MVMENEFDRHELEDFALGIKGHRIDEFQAVGGSQRAPGILLGGKIQIGNGAVLRQVEPCLAAANLFELLRRKLAFVEQQVAGFLLEGIGLEAHGTGTSISFFVFSGNRVV